MRLLQRLRDLFKPTAFLLRSASDGAHGSTLARFLETSRLVTFGLLVLSVAIIAAISFVGAVPAALQLMENQVAPLRITASRSFSYESKIARERAIDNLRSRVPPVYRRDQAVFEEFTASFSKLMTGLDAVAAGAAGQTGLARSEELRRLVSEFRSGGSFQTTPEDLMPLLALPTPEDRLVAKDVGLRALGDLFRTGIHGDTSVGEVDDTFAIVRTVGEGSAVLSARTVPFSRAAATLRANLDAEELPPAVESALFRVLRTAIRPNLVFDEAETEARRDAAVAEVGPVVVNVAAGQTLVDAGQRVSPEVHESLSAYRAKLVASGMQIALMDDRFFARVLLVFAMLLSALFYLRLHDPKTLESNSRLALLTLVTVLNLCLVRLTISLGQLPYFAENPGAASALPYLAPVTLAPLFLTILLGTGPGVFMALVVSFFAGVIHGGRFDVMVMSFLASLVAIYGCQTIRLRSHVVRASALAGGAVAVVALLLGLADRVPMEVVALQMLTGFATGTLSGFLVIGMLPVFESLFRRTTDITLLELTDYNHPLLRRLQMEAPGTYHHSLVVANLAENAAAAIGANGLLARVCALFHDIGKVVKPEYFTENQRGAQNPHDQRNPSMSALIIKSHVKEGVALALERRLPRPVIDTIRQHHGTTLMQFFFTRAKERLKGAKGALAAFPAEQVPEGVYRYDGPKPQFKESAILHLADSVEACSRSLRKVTAQSVTEMVEEITEARIADGQLDECPLTLEELSKIKGSFTFTLLNMLHSRVSYPSEKSSAGGSQGTSHPFPGAAVIPLPTTPQDPAPSERSG